MHRRISSFRYAFQGIWTGLHDQPNIRIHLALATLAIILALVFKITYIEWLVLALTITLVLTTEFINTAIEEIVDSFTTNEHPSAKKAKDVAAAAVLITSIGAVFIGILIFSPYFLKLV